MALDFTTIDFETANSNSVSACSVGIVTYQNSEIVAENYWLIKPEGSHSYFSSKNIEIHGIDEEQVANADNWSAQWPKLAELLAKSTVFAHNANFDMGVIRASCQQYQDRITEIDFEYGCSLQIAKRSFDISSYGLKRVSEALELPEFEHHNALADAKACGAIILAAAKRHGANSIGELYEKIDLQLKLFSDKNMKKTKKMPKFVPVSASD